MNTWLAGGALGIVGLALLALGALLWVRLRGYRSTSENGSGTPGEFTLTRYSPMARLVADEDLNFLRQFESCRPGITARWERKRRRLFRLYLRQAADDFRRIHSEARALMASAPAEHADLVGVLMRHQFTFWRILTVVELRFALSGLGLGRVDANRVLALIDAMQTEVHRSLAPASA